MNRLIVILLLGLTASATAAPQNKRKFVSDDTTRKSTKTDSKGDKAKAAAAKRRDKLKTAARVAGLSEQQQKKAIAFAQKNHPELLPLLKQLKSKERRSDYQRALRDLHSASARFGRLKERVPAKRYEQQLTIWKLDSRIRLQLAKWSMTKDEKLAEEIKTALAERQSLQRRQLEDELQQVDERRARIQRLLGGLTSNSVSAEWKRLSKSVTRRGRTNQNKKSAGKKAAGSNKKTEPVSKSKKKQPQRKNKNKSQKKDSSEQPSK